MTTLTLSKNLWWSGLPLLALTYFISTSEAQETDTPPLPPRAISATSSAASNEGVRHFALIVVGLPGDEKHAKLFQQTVLDWSRSLSAVADVREGQLFVLSGSEEGEPISGARSGEVGEVVGRLTEQLQPDDALWVFFLGHGSYDGQHTWFHLPGEDLHEGGWADLFARIQCREQVFWLTQSASGGFVRALSRPNRIVIASTEPQGEVNETRFPHALNDVLKNVAAGMDSDGDGRLSVLELFQATNADVVSFFEERNLTATEHAQLDDNGDGQGSEADRLIKPGVEQTDDNAPRIDGALAAKVYITIPPENPPTTNENP